MKNKEFIDVKSFINYQKGKPAKVHESIGLPILTPEYLRDNAKAELGIPEKRLVIVKDHEIILLWDGSNSGEFFLSKPGILASTMVVLDFDKSIFHKDYLFYAFKQFEHTLRIQTRGSGIPHVDKETFLTHEVYRPDYKEQGIIAKVLSTIDQTISQTEAVIAKYQRIKTGMMQDFLTCGIDENGEIRDPATHKFKPSPLGMIPDEWDYHKLGGILDTIGGFIQTGPFGSQLHAHEYVDQGIPTIMPKDIVGGRIVEGEIARITEEKANSLKRHRTIINDVIFARRGDLSRAAPITEKEESWLCGTGCFLLRAPVDILNASWLTYIYRFDWIQRQVYAMAIGSTMPNLNRQVMRSLVVPIPKIDEQKEIVERISKINNFITGLRQIRIKLYLIQEGLMQDLLSGKVSVAPLFEQGE